MYVIYQCSSLDDWKVGEALIFLLYNIGYIMILCTIH